MNYSGHAPTTNYDGSGPTQPTDEQPTVPEQETEDEGEDEGEDVEEDDEEPRVPDGDRWMDWDSLGNPRNPRYHRKFTGFLGRVGRRHVPINYTNWKKFGKENPRTTDSMWQEIKVKKLVN